MNQYRFEYRGIRKESDVCNYPSAIYVFLYDNGKAKLKYILSVGRIFRHYDSWYPNHEDALSVLEAWTSTNNYEIGDTYSIEVSLEEAQSLKCAREAGPGDVIDDPIERRYSHM